MCVSLSIIDNYRSVGENTRMMAMNPLHSSDQQGLMAFGYLLNHDKYY